jgi:sugar/nucleoside kinase (ribokinase family)
MFANATASISTSRRGAIPAMPELKEVLELMGIHIE